MKDTFNLILAYYCFISGLVIFGYLFYLFTDKSVNSIVRWLEKRRKKKQAVSLHIPGVNIEGLTEPASITFTAMCDSDAMGRVFAKSNGEEQGMKEYEEIDVRENRKCPHGQVVPGLSINSGHLITVTSGYCGDCKYNCGHENEIPYNIVHCTYKYKHKEQQMEKPTYEKQMRDWKNDMEKWEFLPKVCNGSESKAYYIALWRKQSERQYIEHDCSLCGTYKPILSPCPECPLHKVGQEAESVIEACVLEYHEWEKNPTRENSLIMLDLIKRIKPVKEVEQEYCCRWFKCMVEDKTIQQGYKSAINNDASSKHWYINDWMVNHCFDCGKKPIPPIGK